MPYATPQDITDRYGEDLLYTLADRDRDGQLDTAVVERALDDATAEAEAALRGRYVLPLTGPVPVLLVRVVIDLALAMLPTEAAGDNDLIQARAKSARKLLDSIRKGEVDLGIATTGGAAGGVHFSGPGTVFTPGRLKDF